MTRLTAAIATAGFGLLVFPIFGDTGAPEKPPEFTGGPYCGIYSVYAALKLNGCVVTFEDLADSRYVGSFFGSSLTELQRAAEDHGACARPMEGMTANVLRTSRDPIVLHVREPGRDSPYQHWVLFLGVDDDKAIIVDPPFSAERLSFPELLALWDGVGMVVSKKPVTRGELFWSSWVEQSVLIGFVAVAVLGVRQIWRRTCTHPQRWEPRVGRQLLYIAGLTGMGGLIAIVWHTLHDEGFIGNRPAVALVVEKHFDLPLPLVAVEEIDRFRSEQSATIIDARLPGDYASGHIPGAVNLSIAAGLVERGRILASIPPTNRVIVYCQSSDCHWADSVATDLVFRGYERVAVFRGGYQEWQDRERPRDRK